MTDVRGRFLWYLFLLSKKGTRQPGETGSGHCRMNSFLLMAENPPLTPLPQAGEGNFWSRDKRFTAS